MKFADRLAAFEASEIRRIFELAADLEDPINLSIGQADFDVPPSIKRAAIEAIEKGKNGYTVTQGLPELNRLICEDLRRRFEYEPESSLVTSGVSGALMLAFQVLLNPGDEILIPDPYFLMYKNLAVLSGATPRFYDTYPDFRITREALEEAWSPRAKLILINSPSNPTGATMDSSELELITQFARKKDLFIIADEIYDRFVYDEPFHSACEFTDDLLLISGFSKNLGMAGWRVGYAAGPRKLLDMMKTLQQFSFVCAPAPAQHALLKAFEVDLSAHYEAYRHKRDLVYDGIKDSYETVRPNGSFYMFPRVPNGRTDMEFVEQAVASNLLIVPGSACSQRATHFRLSFAAADEVLERGIEILNKLAANCKASH